MDLAGIENPATTSVLNTSLPEPVPEMSVSSPLKTRGTRSRCKLRSDKHAKRLEVNTDHGDKRAKSGSPGNDQEQLLQEMNQVLAGVGEVSLAEAGSCGVQRDVEQPKTSKGHTGQTSQNATPVKGSRRTKRLTPNGVAAALSPLLRAAQATAEVTEHSPCHRRHKPRDKNHIRAMQQVADWIEKEHTRQCDGAPVVIERHEHHHIHEHHHHYHYHHYHGT